jgi:Asp-tRNA(Asn)/Glu-tRNA(Gln) amidotransferase A subunit family amidase
MDNDCEVIAPHGAPPGLLDAFWRYDRALLGNDQRTLNELFMPGPDTLRGDGKVLLAGHDAIVGFRAARARIPSRRVDQLHVQVVTEDAALAVAHTRDGAATGLQTQLWRRVEGRWVVAAAHVSLPAGPSPAFDRTVWRTVGDPLVPASARGPLDGAGVAVKDLFAVAGHPIGAGVPAWLAEQQPRTRSAPAVAALLAAGAHVVGIARTDEFAYSLAGANAHYGTPPNPAAPGRLSGGSTSGPASAVALGQAAIGLGTDTAGSIRVPASYQGLVGLRSTHGAISIEDVLPLAPSFDTVGWVTRDVRTSQTVAQVLLPPTAAAAPLRTLRLPTIEELAAPDVRDAFRATIEHLAAQGKLALPQTQDLPAELLEDWFRAFRTVQAWQAWQAHGKWITRHPGALGQDVAARFAMASEADDAEAAAAGEVVAKARATLGDWLAGSVVVIPAASGPAPSRTAPGEQMEAARAATLRMTCLAGLAGAPAVSLPLLRGEGYPVGVCLLGAPDTDHQLLALAAELEESR